MLVLHDILAFRIVREIGIDILYKKIASFDSKLARQKADLNKCQTLF